jgi:hypothetical protein
MLSDATEIERNENEPIFTHDSDSIDSLITLYSHCNFNNDVAHKGNQVLQSSISIAINEPLKFNKMHLAVPPNIYGSVVHCWWSSY